MINPAMLSVESCHLFRNRTVMMIMWLRCSIVSVERYFYSIFELASIHKR